MNTRFGLSLFLAGVPLLFAEGPKDNIPAASPAPVFLDEQWRFKSRQAKSPDLPPGLRSVPSFDGSPVAARKAAG